MDDGETTDDTIIRTEEELEEYKELFAKFDKDGNETIEPSELGDALRYIGCNPTDAEVDAMIQEADGKVNDNGKLEFAEFCDIMAKHRKTMDQEEEELREAFKLFDKNGDGSIDRKELKQALQKMGWGGMSETEVDDMITTADTDGSGRIEYNELVNLILGRTGSE